MGKEGRRKEGERGGRRGKEGEGEGRRCTLSNDVLEYYIFPLSNKIVGGLLLWF
jgi:hypothetical protein